MDNNILGTPNNCGWHFFKKKKKDIPCIVYVSEDGVGFAMDEEGETWRIDDFVGEWEEIEPQYL